MKPAAFDYVRPSTIQETTEILAEHGGDARVLAGGQEMVPMLNLRLARPSAVVDISQLAELTTIEVSPSGISIGAMVTLGISAFANTVPNSSFKQQLEDISKLIRLGSTAQPVLEERLFKCFIEGTIGHID